MTRPLSVADLSTIAVPQQPVLAPDGSVVVYTVRTVDEAADRVVTSLWSVPTGGGPARQLTAGPADSDPVFAPDGRRLAFLRGGSGPAQLWLLPLDGGEPVPLTSRAGGAGRASWSPDGTRIAFTAPAVDRESDAAGGQSRPLVTERLDFQADGAGWLTARLHVHVLELDGQSCRQLTRGDWHAGEPVWSPDGTRLAFTAGRDDDADLTGRAGVYLVEAGGNRDPELVGFGSGTAGVVTFHPDGTELFVVGSPSGPLGPAGLYRLPVTGAAAVPAAALPNLAAGLDRGMMPGGPGYPGATPVVTADGDSVLFCIRDAGCSQLYRAELTGAVARPVLAGQDRVVSGASLAGGTVAAVLSTPTSFGEVVTVELDSGIERVLTDHGRALADVRWFTPQPRTFRISDGTEVAGWLIRDEDSDGPRPTLLDIHGGPHNAWNGAADDAHLYHQQLAARGWAVLLLNPRGSDGYGHAFLTAAVGAWGVADAQDFLQPLDELVAAGIADPDRLAVTGYSYGGYQTCYLTAHDGRFAAAVAGGLCSDLTSLAGTSDLGHAMATAEFGGLPWQQRDRLAELSPLTHVDRVRTPTLILHGAADLRCPLGQALQWFSALREQGVPSRLVLYPEASHLMIISGRPSQRLDYQSRLLDWVEQHADRRAPALDRAHWQHRLAELAERHKVPGAQLGILRMGRTGDELVQVAAGVLNRRTDVAATTDSLFQIGSITKVWTATVAMQLVEAGQLDLDAPLVEVLPELRLADPDVAKQVSVRHLLTHTSGIDGDIFDDTGRGEDCLARYVELLETAAQNHPLGQTWSYCNSGFSLLGRVIEKVTGQSWDEAMAERLFRPLGLARTVTLPEQALLHRAAVGHVSEGGAAPQPAPVWGLPRSLGPAGLISSTAEDVLAFARLHLSGGLAAGGSRLLAAETVAAMAAEQVVVPEPHSLGDSWGLGWIRYGWDGQRLIGHDGNTIGQAAFLRLLPSQGLAVTLLTNGGNTRDLYQELFREIFTELAGVAMSPPLAPPAEPVAADIEPWLGRYERASVEVTVLAEEGRPRLRTTITGPLAAMLPDPTEEHELIPVGPELYVARDPEVQTWMPVMFYRLPDGQRYVHFGARATPKVS